MSIIATKKLDKLNQKISSLKQEKQKIQDQLAQEFLIVLQQTQALTLDFPTLIGGLLDVIKKIQSGIIHKEVWQKAGGEFLKSLPKIKADKNPESTEKVA